MPTPHHKVLKWLAAAIWYTGGLMLLLKGLSWLTQAGSLGGPVWPLAAATVALVVGLARGRTVFRRACVRNLERIRGLRRPRPWHVFRPVFFLALLGMFAIAVVFGQVARTGYAGRVVIGGLDLVIGISLLTGATAFWTWRPGALETAREDR